MLMALGPLLLFAIVTMVALLHLVDAVAAAPLPQRRPRRKRQKPSHTA